jgi:hypothetical protein
MAVMTWEVVGKTWCDRVKAEVELLEQRIYPGEVVPDPQAPFQVRARKCTCGLECNLAGFACQYSFTNPNYDPFA